MNRSPRLPTRILEGYRGLNWVKSRTQQVGPTICYSLRLCPSNWLLLWEWWVECTFQGQGRGKKSLIAQVQIVGQPKVMFFR